MLTNLAGLDVLNRWRLGVGNLEALGVDILNRNQVRLGISLSKFFVDGFLVFPPPQVNLKVVGTQAIILLVFKPVARRANERNGATPTSLNFISRANGSVPFSL